MRGILVGANAKNAKKVLFCVPAAYNIPTTESILADCKTPKKQNPALENVLW